MYAMALRQPCDGLLANAKKPVSVSLYYLALRVSRFAVPLRSLLSKRAGLGEGVMSLSTRQDLPLDWLNIPVITLPVS